MTSTYLPVPHIEQRQDGECLAACAAMALAYLGIAADYDQLLKLLEVQWFGAFSSRVRNLEQLGITVVYKQGTLDELREHLQNNRPCIAFVDTSELPYWDRVTGHALLVVGLDDQSVYLNDPAFPNAPVQVSHGDFGLAWLERDEFYAAFQLRS